MHGKLMITMTMRVETGLHIGASGTFAAIGAVNNPIIRDPLTGLPMIPGSSLKGKMRSLLARAESESYLPADFDRESDTLQRVFGCAGNSKQNIDPRSARLQFADAFMSNEKQLVSRGGATEIKFENKINRLTSLADPRQMERIVRGAEFHVKLVYNVEDLQTVTEDMVCISKGLNLVSMDYLGGGGSRGSGRVTFRDVRVGSFPESLEQDGELDLSELRELLGDKYDALHYLQA